MPYYIVPFENGWRVMSKSGAFFSRKPLTLKMAKRQQRALYAKEKRGEMFEGGSFTVMTHNGQPHIILRGDGFFGDIFAKIKSVASNAVKSVGRVATGVLQKASEETSKPIRNDYPPKVREILARYGKGIVSELLIRREPIVGLIDKALNFITLGKWGQVKRELNYDKMFHLSLIATLTMPDQTQVKILIEKNEVINMTTDFKMIGSKMEYVAVPVPCCITLEEMMAKTQTFYGANYFKYDAFNDNCQKFINSILTANGLNTPQVEGFIMQDVETLLKRLPKFISPFARLTTNIAGLADRAIYGEGEDFVPPSKVKREGRGRMQKCYGGVNLKGMMVGNRGGVPIQPKFKAQLEKAGLSPEEYLRKAREVANREGYDGRALQFSDNGVNKLMIYDDEGKPRHFGRVGYGDYIIYSATDKELAEKKRNTFHKSHSKIKGDWKNDKFSPNMLALKINW